MRVLAALMALAWCAAHAAGAGPKDQPPKSVAVVASAAAASGSASVAVAPASAASATVWTARVTRPATRGSGGFPTSFFRNWTALNGDAWTAAASARRACASWHGDAKKGRGGRGRCDSPIALQFSAKESACEMISLASDGGYESGNKLNHCVGLKYDGMLWASQCPDQRKDDAKCYVGDVGQCDGCSHPPKLPPVDWKDNTDAGRQLAIRFRWDSPYYGDFIGYGKSNAAALKHARHICLRVSGGFSGLCDAPPASAEVLDSSRACTMVDISYLGWGEGNKHNFCRLPVFGFDSVNNYKGAKYEAGGMCYIGGGCAALIPPRR